MAIFRKNLSLVPIVSQILPLTDALASRRGSYYWYSDHRLYTQQSYHWVIKYIFTQMLKHCKTSTCLGPMSLSSGNTTELFRTVFWDVLPCKITVDRPSSLMMEAVRTSETSVDNYFSRQYIPEDNSELHTRRRENMKSHTIELCLQYCYLQHQICVIF
jgi:hypothetical protein